VRAFPNLVPIHPDQRGAELHREAMSWFNQHHLPTFMGVGLADPVIGELGMKYVQSQLLGPIYVCKIPDAGHFVQEWGEAVAQKALIAFDFMESRITIEEGFIPSKL